MTGNLFDNHYRREKYFLVTLSIVSDIIDRTELNKLNKYTVSYDKSRDIMQSFDSIKENFKSFESCRH